MAVRAKFRFDNVQKRCGSTAETLTFYAVNDDGIPENEKYHKYTPSGELKITVDNPAALEQFELGKCYYLDFTPAE